MTMSAPHGPYPVPVYSLPSARRLKEDLKEFRQKTEEEIAEAVGCYKSGPGLLPFCVGMTKEKTFRKECFAYNGLDIYNKVLGGCQRGKPVMSFLAHPLQRGPDNRRAIAELEKFLIEKGCTRNDGMQNQRCGEPQCQIAWGIKGVYRCGPGTPSRTAREFAEMMGI